MDFTTIIKTVAPWIGTALGGPLGGMAVTAAANALGLSDKTTDGLKAAISGASPEQMLALKKADDDFALQMQSLGFTHMEKLASLDNDDRNSARQREMTVKDVTPKILAFVVTLGFFGILCFMMFRPVPPESRDILNIMLGSLATAWTGIVAYYFGSTKGAEHANNLLANTTQAEPAQTNS